MESLRPTLQRILAEEDVPAVEHVIHVDVERIDQDGLRVIAVSQSQVGVLEAVDDQRLSLDSDVADLLDEILRLGITDCEIADEHEVPFLHPLRESRLESGLLLLGVHLVRIVTGDWSEDCTAVTMDGWAIATLARAPCALLTEGLFARAGYFGAVLDLVGPLTEAGEVVANRFMNQMLFVRIAEDLFRQVD